MRGRIPVEQLVLIDTSAWIHALRRDADERIKERVGDAIQSGRAAIAPIIRLELLGGTRTQAEFNRLRQRLDALHLIGNDDHTWDIAAEMAFVLRRQGITVPYTDTLIAACAISGDAVLLHADGHFDLLSKKIDLAVESLAR
ncbi:MAG: PIN domain nuclease [Actinobacteria bacterium]|nr:PIN domain nuclease [Actinomycetota bacterium]